MIGLGTVINVFAIVFGGLLGLFFGKFFKASMQETLLTVCGVAVLFIGAAGAFEKILIVSKNSMEINSMLVISLAAGAAIGEFFALEEKIIGCGKWLQSVSKNSKDANFVNAFVTSSCTVCIGAMAIVGSIQDGISGDYSVLLIKSILDAVIICIMTSSMGKGCIFSAVPIALVQGSFTLLAWFVGSFMTEKALENLSCVGSVLIFCVGLNLVREKKIRVANLLPSLLAAVLWGFFRG